MPLTFDLGRPPQLSEDSMERLILASKSLTDISGIPFEIKLEDIFTPYVINQFPDHLIQNFIGDSYYAPRS